MTIESKNLPRPGTRFPRKAGPAGRTGRAFRPLILAVCTLAAVGGMLSTMPAVEDRRADDPRFEPARPAGSPAVPRFEAPASINDARARAADPATRQSPRASPAVAEHAAGSADAAASDDWLPVLYPQLARIAELESAPPAAALAELLPMLANDDPVVRLAALEALADLGRAAPLPALITVLEDSSPQIRLAALEALTLRGEPFASAPIEALVFDSDRRVRIAAIDALAILASPAAVPVLGALLQDTDPAVRTGAVAALGEIGEPRALRYLEPLRHDGNAALRASATAILFEARREAD